MSKRVSHLAGHQGISLPAILAVGGGLVLLGYFITRIFAAGPASMYFSPSSGNENAGTDLAVQIYINTAGQNVNAVESDFTYPAGKLQYTSVDFSGSAFGIAAPQTGGGGTVTIARGNVTAISGTLLVGTVHFTVLSSAGAATLTFLGSSAIVESAGNTNILGSSPAATFTVVVPSTPAPTPPPATHTPTPVPVGGGHTPTPTPKPGTTHAPTPSASPVAGGGTTTVNPSPTPSNDQVANSEPTPFATPAPAGSADSLVAAANRLLGTHLTVMGAAGATVPVLLILGVAGWLLWRHAHGSSIDSNPSHNVPVISMASSIPTAPKVTGAPPASGGAQPKTFMPSDSNPPPPPPTNEG